MQSYHEQPDVHKHKAEGGAAKLQAHQEVMSTILMRTQREYKHRRLKMTVTKGTVGLSSGFPHGNLGKTPIILGSTKSPINHIWFSLVGIFR